jgi:hypothetical protein
MKTKTETKHTPGPWKLDGGIMAKLEGHDVQITCISRTHWCGRMTAEEKRLEAIFSAQEPANARLMSAAPELLEALKALCAWGNHPSLTGLPDGEPVAESAPSFDETVRMVHAAIAKATGKE